MKSRGLRISALIAVLVALLAGTSALVAQPGDQTQRALGLASIPFNLGPPGARSVGMGNTFLAIADDATAAEANPAGLTILTKPELSLHARFSSPDAQVEDLNASSQMDLADAVRTFNGEPTIVRPSTIGTFNRSESTLSFASFVKPFRRFVLSVYSLSATSFDQTASFGGGGPFHFDDDYLCCSRIPTETQFFQINGDIDSSLSTQAKIDHIGVSGAVKLGPKVSLGVSVRSSSAELKIQSMSSLISTFSRNAASGGPRPGIDPVPLLFNEVAFDIVGEDDDLTYNVGLMINPNGKISGGLVFKEGGEFEFARNVTTNSLTTSGTRTVEVPDTIGAGVAVRPNDRLTIALDVVEISYSSLDFQAAASAVLDPVRNSATLALIEPIDDETEVHFGVEYRLLPGQGLNPISLRAGFYTDPDHDGFRTIDSDQDHITVGLGIVLKQRFQIDLAYDSADSGDTALLSGVLQL